MKTHIFTLLFTLIALAALPVHAQTQGFSLRIIGACENKICTDMRDLTSGSAVSEVYGQFIEQNLDDTLPQGIYLIDVTFTQNGDKRGLSFDTIKKLDFETVEAAIANFEAKIVEEHRLKLIANGAAAIFILTYMLMTISIYYRRLVLGDEKVKKLVWYKTMPLIFYLGFGFIAVMTKGPSMMPFLGAAVLYFWAAIAFELLCFLFALFVKLRRHKKKAGTA